MIKPKPSVSAKVQKEMPEFAAEVAGLTTDQLNARLAQLAKDSEAVQEAKENDDDLAESRARSSELAAPYREGKKAINLKSSYIVGLIKDRGQE